jgi:hypothetical protein
LAKTGRLPKYALLVSTPCFGTAGPVQVARHSVSRFWFPIQDRNRAQKGRA